jgi:tyrosinase
MGIRKNQSSLTANEKSRFIAAVLQLKANGVYDRYVLEHRNLFNQSIHNTVLFLPWHREFLRRFELDLQAIDPSVTLPYWDWTVDRSLQDSLWHDNFMGGDGVGVNRVVETGAFAFRNGRWPLTVRDQPGDRLELTRNIGGGNLPSNNTTQRVLNNTPFLNFSANIEGVVHNLVHVWVGGSAATLSSPNDPIFFLLHCNVDRLWAIWQKMHPGHSPFEGDGPFDLNSRIPPWQNEVSPPTPAKLLNHLTLGYSYDTDEPMIITDLTVGAPPRTANIGQAGEYDWYRFTVPAASSYTLETQGNTDVVISLYGPNSQTLLVTEDDDSAGSGNARIISNLSAGTYFVRVRHYQTSGTGNYSISVKGAPPQPALNEIAVNGAEVQGNIAAANESDIYIFNANQTASYTITTSGNTDTFLALHGPNNQNTFITEDDDSGPGQNSQITRVLGPGMYFVRVRHYSPTGTGAYGVSVKQS